MIQLSLLKQDHSTFAEFFAGIGLMRIGLERAGWKVAFASDISDEKRQIYDGHFGDTELHFSVTDIHSLDVKRVPTVELATASFPCTDLSVAGGREGLDRGESSAFWGFHRVIKEMGARRPLLILLENVTGFLTSQGGRDFHRAMLALNDLGYAVDPFILDARWFTPQSRPRLFVVGVREGRSKPRVVSPPAESRLRPRPIIEFIAKHPEINWRIEPLSEPPLAAERTLTEIVEKLSDDDPHWWSQERADYLYNQMSDRHKSQADKMIAGRRWSYGTVFRRIRKGRSMAELRTDGLAGCLRTPKGGSGRQILFRAGYGRYSARLLTPIECARLMGADDYRIQSDISLNTALFGFGDAVCVPVVAWIAHNYLNPLIASRSREKNLQRDDRVC